MCGRAGGGEGAEPARGDRRHPPFSPVRTPSRWRGQRGAGRGARAGQPRRRGRRGARRAEARREGGAAARPPQPLGSTPRAQPGHETLTAARPRAASARRDDGTAAAAKEDARTAARRQVRRRAGRAAHRGEWLRVLSRGIACEGSRSSPHLACAERRVGGSRSSQRGWLYIAGAGEDLPELLLGGRRSARPWGRRRGQRRPRRGGQEAGAAVAIQGLRGSHATGGGGRRVGEGGGESQRRASQRAGRASWLAPRPGAKWRAGMEGNPAGARCPGLGGAFDPGGPGLSTATGGFCQKFYRTSAGKARGRFWRAAVS